MLVELGEGLRAASRAPKQQFVIVATRGQLLVIPRPLKSANFLPVTNQFCSEVLWAPQISVENAVVAAARAQERVVPSDGTDAAIVATQRLNQLGLCRVPDLQLARVGANGEEGAVARPLHARYAIVRADVTQLRDFAVQCRPQVDAGA